MSEVRLGLVGRGLSGSLSPPMYEGLFRSRGIRGMYVLLDIPPESLRGNPMEEYGLVGLNVTKPYKLLAARSWASELAPEAEAIGAVNTLSRVGGSIVGFNTDWAGVVYALKGAGGSGFDNPLVLGYGGAARATIYALALEFSVPRVVVAARSTERAARELSGLARRVGVDIVVTPFHEAPREARASDLIVNATPLGWWGEGDPLPGAVFEPPCTVFDMVYRPLKTPLLDRAARQGCVPVDGLEMLAGQAAVNARIWLGVEADPGELRSYALEALGGWLGG